MTTDTPVLSEQNRQKLDGIVQKMVSNRESDANIRAVVADFKQKYAAAPAPASVSQSPLGQVNDAVQSFGKGFGGALTSLATPFIKGAVGFGVESGKALMSPFIRQDALAVQGQEQARTASADAAGTLIAEAQKQTNPLKRARMLAIAGSAIRSASSLGDQAKKQLADVQAEMPDPLKVLGTGADMALTALPAAKGSLMARAAKMGVTGAGLQVANNLEDGTPITNNVLASGVISSLLPVAMTGIAKGAKNFSSILSGVPKAILERAYTNPKEVGAAVKEFSSNPGAESDLLTRTQEALGTVKAARGKAYREGLAAIDEGYRKTSLIPRAGTTVMQNNKLGGGGDLFTLSKQGLYQKAAGALKDFGVDVSSVKNGTLAFNNSTLSTAEEKQVRDMIRVINGWTDMTPTGMNNLAIKIGNYANHTNSNALNTIASGMKKNLRSYLTERVPEVGPLNASYEKSSQFIDDIKREIGAAVDGSGSKSTAINRLMSLFTRGSNLRQDLVQQLEQQSGKSLTNDIAGATLSKWAPSGRMRQLLEGIGAGAFGTVTATGVAAPPVLPALAGLAAASPRVAGTVARIAGRANQAGITKGSQKAALMVIPRLMKILNP